MPKYIKEAEFKNIKLLQQAGLSQGITAKITGRSSSTASRVYAANTWEEYKSLIKEISKRDYKANKLEQTELKAEVKTDITQDIIEEILRTVARIEKTVQTTLAEIRLVEESRVSNTNKVDKKWGIL